MFATTIAGSLPKPAWLAEPNKLWAPWRLSGEELAAAKRDATVLALKLQEDSGIDIVTEGEQSRQHFVHGFLESFRLNEQSFSAGGLPQWPAKSLIMIGFALLAMQGVSELIKRIAIMRGIIPDPHETQRSALEAEVEHLIEGTEKR